MPGKVTEKVIFWVDVVTKCAGTEEGVQIAAIGELA
jgi:hypothetical protein